MIDASFGTTYLVADNGSGYTTTMCPSQVGRYSSYNFGSTRTLTISSLDDNKLYNFDFYASRSINSSTTRFTINGTNSTITTLNNSANKASFTNVAPASGRVTVTIWRASGDCDFVNGFTIVEQTSTGTPPSAYPTASAGVNKGITEPTATVTLVGSGYDSDGTINSYAWTKVSGDAATIMQPTAATTVINKLEPGSYVFRLTVTDNTGLTASSDVSVNVALAPGHKQLNVNVTGATSYANSEWNNWNVSSSLSVNNFNYSDGTASTIDAVLSAQTNVWDNGVGYTLGRMWPGAISRFASYNAGGSRTLTISSLDNNKKYRIRLYATNVQTTHVTRFTINGTNSDVPTYNNDSTVAIFDNLTPSSGTITVSIWRNAGSFDFLNGFTILEKGTVTGAIQDVADSNYVYDAIGNLVKDKTEKIDSIYWTLYGKISEIAKTPAGSSTVQKIRYTYDAAGNRISKLVIRQGADSTYTQYVRDAQGNVMAVYSSNTLKADSLLLNEHHLYGSSRLGIVNRELNVSQPAITGTSLNLMGMSYLSSFERGRKSYELSNHLGNVLVTVSDKKLGFDLNGDGKVDYYGADVVSANDYYPFGSLMSARKYSAPNSKYRYGFQGQEKDNEIKGEGNSIDFSYRIYDPRLGKFLSIDPLSRKYPFYSPYHFSSNQPIHAREIEGLESEFDLNLPLTSEGVDANHWKLDPSHKNPNGMKWIDVNGNSLYFDKAQPGKTGNLAKDHFHFENAAKQRLDAEGNLVKSKGAEASHLKPGTQTKIKVKASVTSTEVNGLAGTTTKTTPTSTLKKINGTLNSFFVVADVVNVIRGINNGDPDALINLFGSAQVGQLRSGTLDLDDLGFNRGTIKAWGNYYSITKQETKEWSENGDQFKAVTQTVQHYEAKEKVNGQYVGSGEVGPEFHQTQTFKNGKLINTSKVTSPNDVGG